MKKNSGFTVVEVLVSAGLLAIFMVAASSILRDIYQISQKNKTQIESATDLSLSMRYLSSLLSASGPSYNNIKGNKDDNGYEFFDHIYDVSLAAWSKEEATRTLTLSVEKNKFDFFLIIQSEDQLDQIFYNPLDAYKPPEPVAEMDASATLEFEALNRGNVISKLSPNVWQESNLILMKVPVPLRYVAADGSVNMNMAPRQHSFLGIVKGNTLTQDTFGGHSYTTHPITNVNVPNADTFLRTVPTVGGSSPIIELTTVKAFRITLQKQPNTNYYDLYSYEYFNGQFINPFLIAPKVEKIVFTRESVGLNIVSIEMAIDNMKK